MKAKKVFESESKITTKDCVNAIIDDSHGDTKPSDWKRISKRGRGIITREFENRITGDIVVVYATETEILEIKSKDEIDEEYPTDPRDWSFDVTEEGVWDDGFAICLSMDGYSLDDELRTANLPVPVKYALIRAGIEEYEAMEAVWGVEDSENKTKEQIIKDMEKQGFIYTPGIFDNM